MNTRVPADPSRVGRAQDMNRIQPTMNTLLQDDRLPHLEQKAPSPGAIGRMREPGPPDRQRAGRPARTSVVAALAAATLLLAVCFPSVHPYYTEKDLVFEPRLVGDWCEKEKEQESAVWRFVKKDDLSYDLTIREKDGKEGQFVARFFKLKGESFLDLIPAKCDYVETQAEIVACAMLPGHLLVRVVQTDAELGFAFFDWDWLDKLLKENPQALAHLRQDDRVVITAPTKALQRFVLKHVGQGEMFDDLQPMVRKAGGMALHRLP